MRTKLAAPLIGAVSTSVASAAGAGELDLTLTLPEKSGIMIERPYLAVWIETADDSFVRTLSIWHRQRGERGGPLRAGDRFLNELRTWWRSSGTLSQMPIDGVSGPTRAPGTHTLQFKSGEPPLDDLPPGKYQLVVEAARELKGPPPGGFFGRGPGAAREGGFGGGGRPGRGGFGEGGKSATEVVRLEFEWPAPQIETITESGSTELGEITLTVDP